MMMIMKWKIPAKIYLFNFEKWNFLEKNFVCVCVFFIHFQIIQSIYCQLIIDYEILLLLLLPLLWISINRKIGTFFFSFISFRFVIISFFVCLCFSLPNNILWSKEKKIATSLKLKCHFQKKNLKFFLSFTIN